MKASLSRVHPEITAFANGYVSLEPFFQAYGLSGFYERLKKELWLLAKMAEEHGYFRMKNQAAEKVNSEDEVTQEEPAVGVEPVVEATQEGVTSVFGTAQGQREEKTKGVRKTTRNISVEDILGTLAKLGISASRQNGTAHLILKGMNVATQKPATCSISVSSIGDNSGPYIARASRTFGFTRKAFLKALSDL